MKYMNKYKLTYDYSGRSYSFVCIAKSFSAAYDYFRTNNNDDTELLSLETLENKLLVILDNDENN